MTCLIRWLYINMGNKWISLFSKTEKYGCLGPQSQAVLIVEWSYNQLVLSVKLIQSIEN